MKCIRVFSATKLMIVMASLQYCRSFRFQYIIQSSSLSSLKNYSRKSSCRLFASSLSSDGEGRKRLVFLGTPDVAATTLRSLHDESQKDDCPFEIVGVVTQPPKRRKRKGKLEPSPVGFVAEEIGIPVLCPESVSFP